MIYFGLVIKKYISRGMSGYGKYIMIGNKKQIRFKDVTKIFHFGSFCWLN